MISEITELPSVSLVSTGINPDALNLIPRQAVVRHRIMPMRHKDNMLEMACDRLIDPEEEEQLRVISGLELAWSVCTSREMDECIKHYYGVGLKSFIHYVEHRESREQTGQPDIIGFVEEILKDAIANQATDVHFEPYEDSLHLRYRMDGVLNPIPMPEGVNQFSRAVISCIKVMAQLNIAEKRLPQDGRFSMAVEQGKTPYDLRVSVLPTRFGEAVNLRILNRQAEFLCQQELGLSSRQRKELLSLISQPYGIVLFTGPTGSGKTTSLYAALEYLNQDERKIITLEDPVEYQLKGIVQLQVQPEIGFTFPGGLRSILRHDPDVVLIGEIRDEETARIAISAALTGHLVFSTLHTNDSVSAATRLLDMGIEPYLVASSVQGLVAQRLLRRICPACKEEVTPQESVYEEIQQSFVFDKVKPQFHRGRGCPLCRFMGYQGRQAIFELLTLREPLRKLIINRTSSETLMQQAMQDGMVTLRQSAWAAAVSGITTIEEVLRLTRPGITPPRTIGFKEILAD